jgi:hypothetical protein
MNVRERALKQESITQYLRDFLIQDDISVETNIVNDIIFQMAEIPVNKENLCYIGFDFLHSNNDQEMINFRVPTLKISDLNTLLEFFDVNPDQYIAGTPFKIPYVFCKALADIFMRRYSKLKEMKSDIIKEYQIKSKSILEDIAIRQISNYVNKAIALILPEPRSEIPNELIRLVDHLQALKSNVASLGRHPGLYKQIIFSEANIKEFVNLLKTKKPQLAALIETLETLNKEGVQIFKRYHRTESVFGILDFDKTMKVFLQSFRIHPNCCDVIEDSLFRLAKITLGPKKQCKFEPRYDDKSRLVFTLKDISKVEANKLLQYFLAQGDETAIRSSIRSSSSFGGEEKAAISSLPDENPSEEHSIEIDGRFLYNVMRDKLQKELKVTLGCDPILLQAYQKASSSAFKEAKPSERLLPSSLGLNFHNLSLERAPVDPPSFEPSSFEPSSFEPSSFEPSSFEPSSFPDLNFDKLSIERAPVGPSSSDPSTKKEQKPKNRASQNLSSFFPGLDLRKPNKRAPAARPISFDPSNKVAINKPPKRRRTMTTT